MVLFDLGDNIALYPRAGRMGKSVYGIWLMLVLLVFARDYCLYEVDRFVGSSLYEYTQSTVQYCAF